MWLTNYTIIMFSHNFIKLLIALTVIAGTFSIGRNVYGAVISSQTNYNVSYTNTTNGGASYLQTLGNGFSGSIASSSVTVVYAQMDSGNYNRSAIHAELYGYNNSGYTSVDLNTRCWYKPASYPLVTTNTPTVYTFYEWGKTSTDHSACVDLDPSKYYVLLLVDPTGVSGNSSLFYGTDINLYSNGYAKKFGGANPNLIASGMTGTVEDFFFILDSTYSPDVSNLVGLTRFISLVPENGTTTATTTTVGATLVGNPDDFSNFGRLHIHFMQDSAFACENSGAVYDAVNTCAGENSPASPFDLDFGTTTATRILAGTYDFSNEITFPRGGKWTGTYEIQQVSSPWYFLGLYETYNTIVSTTTHITIGQLSPMDIVRGEVSSTSASRSRALQTGIDAVLASTTASLKTACSPFSSGFDMGDCLVLMIYPSEQAMSDNFIIIKQTPPWGYVFRVIDILNATTSTTTLPTISYSFASTSPMASVGNIHFDPFGLIADAGTLINEMKSDQEGNPTVWTIMMPVVKAFIYLVLLFKIIHDITGIHSEELPKRREGLPDIKKI